MVLKFNFRIALAERSFNLCSFWGFFKKIFFFKCGKIPWIIRQYSVILRYRRERVDKGQLV